MKNENIIKAEFQRDGYVFIPDFLDGNEIAAMNDSFSSASFFDNILLQGKFKQLAELLLDAKVTGKRLDDAYNAVETDKPGTQPRDYLMLGPSLAVTMWMALEPAGFPAKPGDLLVHHALIMHPTCNKPNGHTPGKALGLIYFSEQAKKHTETRQAYN